MLRYLGREANFTVVKEVLCNSRYLPPYGNRFGQNIILFCQAVSYLEVHTVGHKTNAWYKHREKVDIDLTHKNSCSLGSSSVQKSKFGFSHMLTLRISVDWVKKKN